MSQSSNPPEDERRNAVAQRRNPTVPVLLGVTIVTASIAVWSVLISPASLRIPLAIGLGAAAVIVSVSVSLAVHNVVKVARARAETEWYREQIGLARVVVEQARMDADLARVDTERFRIDAERSAQAVAIDTATRLAAADENVAHYAREAHLNENRRSAAVASFASAAGRMQAMMTSMLAELREMEHRHGDPAVLADLLELDHRTAQAGRLADSVAVLSGARSGRRWAKPIAMESILRGAMGRVAGYQRVRLRAVADVAVLGHAAEGVMHALAELIDNACNFSPPTTEVHVYAAEVPAGVVVTIEDSGLVMSESALRRAEQAVSGSTPGGRDLSSLTGTRLGLAVVGHLARKHTLTVSYRPSAIGGTAVVVVVPRELTARLDRTPGATTVLALPAAGVTVAAAPRGSAGSIAPAPISATTTAQLPVATDARLPKRRRGSTLAAVHPDGLSSPAGAENVVLPPSPARPDALGAFQRAVTGRDIDAAAAVSPSVAVEND
ncbi:sensor histidine kinase [Nocardia sp. alder85J]|uniref:sensor histidine kinase n=1 Tax=Nocardia sp. alder85J TaxID=2862949 RepID=UPI00225419D1|nr:ATP-binding protein [Nocardia sp. alder85J]MCX4095448.1 ATP-binding protein [Nocardia sp. alder85J]